MDIVLSFIMFEFFVIFVTVFIWGFFEEYNDSFLKTYCLIHGFISIIIEFLVFGYCLLSVCNFSFMK